VTLLVDLSDFPIVDNHCHAFLPEKEDEDFDQFFNLSNIPIPRIHTENTLFYRKAIQELARSLNCPFDFENVVSKRKEAYASNPKEYIQRLFDEVGIETLIVDTGYPNKEFTGYSIPLETFKELVGCRVTSLYRLKPLIFRLFQEPISFDDLLGKYLESIDTAVKEDHHVGLKTTNAYGYGLEIRREDPGAAKRIYEALRRDGTLSKPLSEKRAEVIEKERVLRRFLVWKGIEKSIEHDIPFQIHTGIGDSPWIDLRDSNPLQLIDILRDEKLREAKIVIVHAGYPFVEEAGYLANNYPNVYVDLSEMIPFIGPGIKNKILDLLEMTPVTKILYGSDAHKIPELYWISALLGKRALNAALNALVQSEVIDEDYAYEVGRMILSENAKRLYRL
jgi:hypothetical protein